VPEQQKRQRVAHDRLRYARGGRNPRNVPSAWLRKLPKTPAMNDIAAPSHIVIVNGTARAQ
jgi:hypothetical protein